MLAYSIVDKLELKLNYYLPSGASGALPAIICFHRKKLIVDDRQQGMPLKIGSSVNHVELQKICEDWLRETICR